MEITKLVNNFIKKIKIFFNIFVVFLISNNVSNKDWTINYDINLCYCFII